jgi:HSP20 family protein
MFYLTPFSRNQFLSFDPFKEIAEIEKNFWGTSQPSFRTDVKETETSYILEAELPGFEKNEISLQIKDNRLTISASHSENKDNDEKCDYLRRERSYSSYTRSFALNGINKENISASYKNGILKLILPKEEEKKIEVRTLEIE